MWLSRAAHQPLPHPAQRIDANTDDAAFNIEEGHNQILKYKNTVLSNRGLILKIFGVLFFFIIFFGTTMHR